MADLALDLAKVPFYLTGTDRAILSQDDVDFKYHSWNELRWIIENDRFDLIRRTPAGLRKYIKWSTDVLPSYGSSSTYIRTQLLRWNEAIRPANPNPFDSCHDYKILMNEHPYAMEPGVSHLTIWLKQHFQTDPVTGKITVDERQKIQIFIDRTFTTQLRLLGLEDAHSRVLWFRSFGKYMTVPSLEHIHVFLKDVSESRLRQWINSENILHT